MLALDGVVARQDGFVLRADWAVPQGSRVAVIGPSGAGKSTLLAVIAGFLAPAAGAVRVSGQDLGALRPGLRPVSILFQDQNLFPHLTAAQNVGLGLRPDLRLTVAQRGRVAQALDRVGLAGLGDRRPGALSGGQQSRVALARALLRARPVLLLDEPFGALGPGLKDDMLGLVEAIAAETGATVLLVTHDPAEARRLCPLASVVADGQSAAPAPTAALLADPPPPLAGWLGGARAVR